MRAPLRGLASPHAARGAEWGRWAEAQAEAGRLSGCSLNPSGFGQQLFYSPWSLAT